MFPKFAKSRFQEEFLSLTERVGHHPVTPFERRVLPLAFGGRDLAVEVPRGEDITAAMVLAGLPAARERSGENVSVVLTSNPDSVRKIGQQLRLVAARWDKSAYTVSIGLDENIKKELQLLSRPPDIIVGTPERLIDHIR
ncbi:MAG TPA: DEAD/DEAH box helicase, partial [Spirochaetia bacterium]|nr:DEAD/DEAH box helicase [Spirochaetia bacterium]